MEENVPYQTNGNDQPTPGAQWRAGRERGYLQQLPVSGHYVRLRPITPDILIETGEIPDTLTPLVVRMLFQGMEASTDEMYEEGQSPERAQASLDLINLVCRLAFVEPVVVEDPQTDNEIHVTDIPLPDRAHVFELTIRGAEMLKSFRNQPTPDVEPLPDQQEQPLPAQ